MKNKSIRIGEENLMLFLSGKFVSRINSSYKHFIEITRCLRALENSSFRSFMSEEFFRKHADIAYGFGGDSSTILFLSVFNKCLRLLHSSCGFWIIHWKKCCFIWQILEILTSNIPNSHCDLKCFFFVD